MPHAPRTGTRPPWKARIITLFPEMFPGPLGVSLVGQALAAGLWTLDTVPLRDFGEGRHRQVDDTPAGGGAGMVLRADVVAAAIDYARKAEQAAATGTRHATAQTAAAGHPALYLSPRGKPLTQAQVKGLAAGPGVLLLAGRFEGVDERVLEARNVTEVSIGDYVLSGGELPAMVLIDACVRLIPGVIGASESLAHESFENDLLEYPQYTRPRQWEGLEIPDVLLSGDHGKIAAWRRDEAVKLTHARRPDLLGPKRET